MICPQCHQQVEKVKPELWYCKNCHVFLHRRGGTQKVLVSKKAMLDRKAAVSKPYLFGSLINKHVQVECVEGTTVEGILLAVEPSKRGAWGNMIIEAQNPFNKAEIIIQGIKIRTIKMKE